jgi:hypothetical protein
MLLLQREFSDGPGLNELVTLHYTLIDDASGLRLARASAVMPPGRGDGRRSVALMLPDPADGAPLRLEYGFSTVSNGNEWRSPTFSLPLSPLDGADGLSLTADVAPGNLPPAAGCGTFRMAIPLRNPASGPVRFGFGAMRKKPSESLCRSAVPPGAAGDAPVVEAPEALSVLKGRPMPYFFYHVDPADGQLRQDKIAPARITFIDDRGDVVAARLLWGDSAWLASNRTVMELKNYGEAPYKACEHDFSDDPAGFAAGRMAELSKHPLPRTFETFVAGPSGSEVEYCFQLLIRDADGTLRTEWRNPESGGNWRITL